MEFHFELNKSSYTEVETPSAEAPMYLVSGRPVVRLKLRLHRKPDGIFEAFPGMAPAIRNNCKSSFLAAQPLFYDLDAK